MTVRRAIALPQLIFLSFVGALVLACVPTTQPQSAPSTPTAISGTTDTGPRARITVPDGWVSEQGLNSVAGIQASNRAKELYLVVLTQPRSQAQGPLSALDYSTRTLEDLVERLDSITPGPKAEKEISGYPAVQYFVQGTHEGKKLGYLHTTVMSDSNFYQIVLWTEARKFNKRRKLMEDITATFEEVR